MLLFPRISCRRMLSTSIHHVSSNPTPKTAIVMLNMGGPRSLDDPHTGVAAFLHRLFTDPEIIDLGPTQSVLGPAIAKLRTNKVRQQYSEIGGKSPIYDWTEYQGKHMCLQLDSLSPQTGPHKHYTTFRYAPPLTEDVLKQMKEDGIKRAVAFSQYPHYSCTTSGSSFNHLWRELIRLGLDKEFTWSVIDRWPTAPRYIEAIVDQMTTALTQFPKDDWADTVFLFTAHSIPMKIVARGDPYVQEIAGTVQAVMDCVRKKIEKQYIPKYVLSWQSKVGFLPWMAPSTEETIKSLGEKGVKRIIPIPIAFTSDHIETLYEINMEYKEVAETAGITDFVDATSLNDSPLLIQAQAELVAEHLSNGHKSSSQYELNCPGCVNPWCRTIVNPVVENPDKTAQVV